MGICTPCLKGHRAPESDTGGVRVSCVSPGPRSFFFWKVAFIARPGYNLPCQVGVAAEECKGEELGDSLHSWQLESKEGGECECVCVCVCLPGGRGVESESGRVEAAAGPQGLANPPLPLSPQQSGLCPPLVSPSLGSGLVLCEPTWASLVARTHVFLCLAHGRP